MRVITGSHEEKTGQKNREGQPILKTIVDSVVIPDEPKSLSDFPKEVIAAVGKPREDGAVCVVTVDGKKFYVKPGVGSRDSGPGSTGNPELPKPPSAAEGRTPKPAAKD
jgi:hypothetical protein